MTIGQASPVVRPWPKTARPGAPDAFRIDILGDNASGPLAPAAGTPGKLVCDPAAGGCSTRFDPAAAAVESRREWLVALAAAAGLADMRVSSQPMSVSIPMVTVEQVGGQAVALYRCPPRDPPPPPSSQHTAVASLGVLQEPVC